MKFISNTLYIEFQEALDAGISGQTIRLAKHRNSASWSFINDPTDKRKVLIQYDTLKDQHKALITSKYGNPYSLTAQKNIKTLITTDHKALQILTKHRFDNGNALSTDQLTEFSKACNILNFLQNKSPKEVKAYGFNGMPTFYESVIELIKKEGISLPKTYTRLREAVRNYETQGVNLVIGVRFGNQNARKITNGICIDLLIEMISHQHQFDAAYIAAKYNKWATENGHESISRGTVIKYKSDYELQTVFGREGEKKFHSKFGIVAHRRRPSEPLLLINSDDNDLDLYFIEGKDKYKRFTLVVVIDAFNDYPLGYAIGETQTAELTRAAYLDAIHHVHDITGEWCFWHEIKADRWGLKQLEPFYKQQADFTPAQAKNARGKVIEQSFGYHWHALLKQFPNYAGHNVKAKETLDGEYIQKRIKDLPDASEAPEYIAEFFSHLRKVETKNGSNRQQDWLKAFANCKQKRTLTAEQRLLYYGFEHKYSARLKADGINVTINNQRVKFIAQPTDYITWVGSEFIIKYDPYLPKIALATTPDGTGRIMVKLLTDADKIPMAIKDRVEGDGLKGYNRLQEQKYVMQHVLQHRNDRKERLASGRTHAESILQAGVLVKETRQLAENIYKLPELTERTPSKEFDTDEWLANNL